MKDPNMQIVPVVARPEVTLEVIQRVAAMAPIITAARMYGVTEEQAGIVMFTAHELGLPKTLSLNGLVYVIDTPAGKKVTLSGVAMNALIQQSGLCAEMEITNVDDPASGAPAGCHVRMKRADNGMEHTESFLLADAQRVHETDLAGGREKGLLDKYNWKAYGRDMYFHRALARCARRVFPDVISGMHMPDELGVVTDRSGAPMLEGTYTDVAKPVVTQTTVIAPAPPAPAAPSVAATTPATPPAPPVAAPMQIHSQSTPQDAVSALLEKADLNVNNLLVWAGENGFDATAIMAANGGLIPDTSEKCREVLLAMSEGEKDAQ